MTEINPWIWAGFVVCIVFFIALDLGAFSRKTRATGIRSALVWSGIWMSLALLFAAGLFEWRGRAEATQFITGYLIELSLSLDNILVMALIFAAFHVPLALQHRALLWGILGAIVLRGTMIGLGSVLIQQFNWMLYVFGGFLVLAGIKTALTRRPVALEPETNSFLRLLRRWLPVSDNFDGDKFLTLAGGRRALTPLALVLVLVESGDLIFALDSVPAVFSVTRSAFIVFTSNVLALIGLRSLYFVLAGALDYFRYLKFGLALVLVFVGAKMLLELHGPQALWFQQVIPNGVCLMVIAGILAGAMTFSVIAARRERGVHS